jgi:hypothetical protein
MISLLNPTLSRLLELLGFDIPDLRPLRIKLTPKLPPTSAGYF